MYGDAREAPQATNRPRPVTCQNPKVRALLNELMDEDDSDVEGELGATSEGRQWEDPARPWLQGFHQYLNTQDILGDLSIVQWWGINSVRYPVWGSLARDFLSIMSSSVSSERVFSSAGITISKRRNCLKADIVEALQFHKCASKSKLLFRQDLSVLAETTQEGARSDESDGEDTGDGDWDLM